MVDEIGDGKKCAQRRRATTCWSRGQPTPSDVRGQESGPRSSSWLRRHTLGIGLERFMRPRQLPGARGTGLIHFVSDSRIVAADVRGSLRERGREGFDRNIFSRRQAFRGLGKVSGLFDFKASFVAFVLGVLGATGYAVAERGEESGGSPQTSTNSPRTSSSSDSGSGCELSDRWATSIEIGAISEESACQLVELAEQEVRQGPPEFRSGPSLLIEGTVGKDLVGDCRTSTFHSGGGAEIDALYCNAILELADGELKPTETCGPPRCSEPGTPIWSFSKAQLRQIAEVN